MLKERYPNVINSFKDNLAYLNGGLLSMDLDAVVQATYVKALNHASHGLKKVIDKNQLISYWELDNISRINGIPAEKSLEFTKGVYNRYDVYRSSPQMPGIKSLLEILNEIEVPYVFISSRPPEFIDATRSWFAEIFPWVPPENIILGRREGMTGGEFKSGVINNWNVVLHIEDATEEANEIVRNTPAKVLMVPQPWNVDEIIEDPKVKYLGPYTDTSGVWPVIRFLSSNEAKLFLQ